LIESRKGERVKPVEIPKTTETEAEEPAVSGGCRKHPAAGGWPKCGGWWCITCGSVV